MIVAGFLAFLVLAAHGPSRVAPAQTQQPSLVVRADTSAGGRAVLRIAGVLAEEQLANAVQSGLPLRVKSRVELWKDGFFDHLEATEEWTSVVLFEPLDRVYLVRLPRGEARRFVSFDEARASIESEYPLDIAPHRSGNYYYTATLEIETLSLSDLDELERWLRGELGPAVSGQRSIGNAIGEGAKRLLIRVLGLPSRRLEARSQKFRTE